MQYVRRVRLPIVIALAGSALAFIVFLGISSCMFFNTLIRIVDKINDKIVSLGVSSDFVFWAVVTITIIAAYIPTRFVYLALRWKSVSSMISPVQRAITAQ